MKQSHSKFSRQKKYFRLLTLSGGLVGIILLSISLHSYAHMVPFAFWKSHNIFFWEGGPTLQTQSGVYGVLGVANSANYPGERWQSVSWIDSSGNFWLFGGEGFDCNGNMGSLNDLWRYSPVTGMWTWMGGASTINGNAVYGTKGTGNTNNIPGARSEAVGWIDGSGNFWFFGGDGWDANGNFGYLSDLWKYTPSNGKWTWVSGPKVQMNGSYGTKGVGNTSNYPGGRSHPLYWMDSSGNFWFFGGYGSPASGTSLGFLNDLWNYNTSTGKWMWVSGATSIASPGSFGTKGVGATSNTPSARSLVQGAWYDGTNLWLFGGLGNDSAGNFGNLSDVWEYNPSTNKWAWMAGSNVTGESSIYGTKGVGSTSNTPGARHSFISFQDSSGNFWLYGGEQGTDYFSQMTLGDLWQFNPATLAWMWVSGPSSINQTGVFGTQGVSSTSNIPGTRSTATGGIDSSGNLWLYGGFGINSLSKFSLLTDFWKYTLSNSNWTWVAGNTNNLQLANYGTQGVASATNWPSARGWTQNWTDTSGNFWLFGGWGTDSRGTQANLSDLWKYDPLTGQWTWVSGPIIRDQAGVYGTQGVGSTSNNPGSRSSGADVADSSGNLWLFGGSGIDSSNLYGDLNDLWKYNPSNGQWTWVSGSSNRAAAGAYGTKGTGSTSNTPGARDTLVSWIDSSNNIWLFGGYGPDDVGTWDVLNDLWKYNPSNGQWTWMAGAKIAAQSGVYGTQGVANISNAPGARQAAAAWKDLSGNLWLFGGYGYDSTGALDIMNDLWKYNTSTGQWTWVSGSKTVLQAGTYGTLGVLNSNNVPGARQANVTYWTDAQGNFWLFGGFGLDSTSTLGEMNDLWKFDPNNGMWTWMKGSSTIDANPVYGTNGVASLNNVPGARAIGAAWVDKNNNTWIFGGDAARDSSGVTVGPMNDLWKLTP